MIIIYDTLSFFKHGFDFISNNHHTVTLISTTVEDIISVWILMIHITPCQHLHLLHLVCFDRQCCQIEQEKSKVSTAR